MSVKVDSDYSVFFSITNKPDAEWQRIIEKLWNQYGIRSSGSKALDKQILHELELREAKLNPLSVNISKFLTLTKADLEKLKDNVKEKKNKKNNVSNYPEITKGAELLGQQIFLAIQLKKEYDANYMKKKRDNKYQS